MVRELVYRMTFITNQIDRQSFRCEVLTDLRLPLFFTVVVDTSQVPLSQSELSASKHSYHAEMQIVMTVQVYLPGQR
jgi:hypothetical protein